MVAKVLIKKSDPDSDYLFLETETKQLESINLRFIYGMRCVGKGRVPARLLYSMMNIPAPIASFQLHQKVGFFYLLTTKTLPLLYDKHEIIHYFFCRQSVQLQKMSVGNQ